MNRMGRKFIATLLALVMLLGMTSLPTLAAETVIYTETVIVGSAPATTAVSIQIPIVPVIVYGNGNNFKELASTQSLTVTAGEAQEDLESAGYLIGGSYEQGMGAEKLVTALQLIEREGEDPLLQYKTNKGSGKWQDAKSGYKLFLVSEGTPVAVAVSSAVVDETNDASSVGAFSGVVKDASGAQVADFTIEGNGGTELQLPIGQYTLSAENPAYDTPDVSLNVTGENDQATLTSTRLPVVVTIQWEGASRAPKNADGSKSMKDHKNFVLKAAGKSQGYTDVKAEGGSSATQTFTYTKLPLRAADGGALDYAVDETSNKIFASATGVLTFSDLVGDPTGETKLNYNVSLDQENLTITNSLTIRTFTIKVKWNMHGQSVTAISRDGFFRNNIVIAKNGEALSAGTDYSAVYAGATTSDSYDIDVALLRDDLEASDLDVYERHVRWNGSGSGSGGSKVGDGSTVYLRCPDGDTLPFRASYSKSGDGFTITNSLLPSVQGTILWSSGLRPDGAQFRLVKGKSVVQQDLSDDFEAWGLAVGDNVGKTNDYGTVAGAPVLYTVQAKDDSGEWISVSEDAATVTIGGVAYQMTGTHPEGSFNDITVAMEGGAGLAASFLPAGNEGSKKIVPAETPAQGAEDEPVKITMPTTESLGWEKPQGKVFLGWAKGKDKKIADYQAGQKAELTEPAEFTPIWGPDAERSVTIEMAAEDGGELMVGKKVVLTGHPVGYDGMELQYQWQSSPDETNWTDVDGDNSNVYRFTLTDENNGWYWRLKVTGIGIK